LNDEQDELYAGYAVCAIGSKYFVLGFRGIGCRAVLCTDPEEMLGHLKRGIYIIEPSLARPVHDKLERINNTDPDVTIIVYGSESLQDHIERATGMVLG
jgi:vacuolar-type H+-ATPase subunit F/Vma7